MREYAAKKLTAGDLGIRLIRSSTPRGNVACDTAVIYDGKRLITILYPLELRAEQEILSLDTCELSKREREVLSLVAQGYSTLEIRKRLFIAKSTVRKHLNNAYKKLPEKVRGSLLRRRSRV
jgi:DNA-binding CsgD family transcriptional regulator